MLPQRYSFRKRGRIFEHKGFLSVWSEVWTHDFLQGPRAAARRFWDWYRDTFFSLFPHEAIARMNDRGDCLLILKAGQQELWCMDRDGNRCWRLPTAEIASSSLEEALARRSLGRSNIRIGLEIEVNAFLVRRFEIPSVALENLPNILITDIERKTPFSIKDVIYGHTIARSAAVAGKVLVSLWILRRDIAVEAAAKAGLEISSFSFIRPTGNNDFAGQKPVIELERRAERAHHFRNVALGLCASAVTFAVIGVVAILWRQATIKEGLDARIGEMTVRASHVRQIIDKSTAEIRLLSVLREARHNRPFFADLWEETAHILPDSAFVTDMGLVEKKPGEYTLHLVGFASSAVGLPALFNESALFADAALTAPITPDQQEKREGFTIEAKIERRPPENAR